MIKKPITYNPKPISYQSGIATMEILIAMVVLTLSLTAVILVLFGGQSVTTDAQTNHEALYIAQKEIEDVRSQSRGAASDFYSISSTPTATEDIYDKQVVVSDINPCVKRVSSNVGWTLEQRPQAVSIATILSSVEAVLDMGGDCGSDSEPISEWWYPNTFKDYDLKSIEPPAEQSANAGVPATSIDVVKRNGSKYAVITTAHSSEEDLWIINVDDGLNAFIVKSLETESVGLNTADVAGDFAFALSKGSPTTQPSELQVIDLSIIDAPSLVATKSLDISGLDNENSPNANVIYYYDGKIYVGTHKTGGKEFQIFSATAPYDRIAELKINHNINDIIVRGDYAYLATSDDGCLSPPCLPNSHAGELMVIDINPASPDYMVHPDITGTWYDAKSRFDGTALFLLGNKIYLGRAGGNYINSEASNFLVLDISNPDAVTLLGSKFIPDNNSPNKAAGIKAFQITGDFAFIATDVDSLDFQVYRVSNPAEILNCGELSPPPYANCGKYNFPAKMTDLEFMDNLIYASIESNATFRIIFDNLICYEDPSDPSCK